MEHLGGDKSPIALARRGGLGSLPGKEKADAGKRVNIFRTRINNAYDARREVLLAERDAAVLVAEAIDVTLPPIATPSGGRDTRSA